MIWCKNPKPIQKSINGFSNTKNLSPTCHGWPSQSLSPISSYMSFSLSLDIFLFLFYYKQLSMESEDLNEL